MSLAGILILLLFQLTGEVLTRFLNLSIPGPVIGMALMFISLFVYKPLYQKVSSTTHSLLKNMALFFIPAGVGIVTLLDQLKNEIWAVIAITVIGTFLTMIVTASTFHFAHRKER